MNASERIRTALAQVQQARCDAQAQPTLASVVAQVKRLQAARFAGTYADLLCANDTAACARFFLEELYGAADFSARDAQFARVASFLERTLPERLLQACVRLAQLHACTEQMDLALARLWPAAGTAQPSAESASYVHAWRALDAAAQRRWQLESVVTMGQTLTELTRKPGLRLLLRAMREPAQLAGLSQLQRFLETGFDTFAQLARDRPAVQRFLQTVAAREASWLDQLDAAPAPQVQQALARAWQAAL